MSWPARAASTTRSRQPNALQRAGGKLRDAAQALAKDPYSKRRNETIKDINKALLDTQQVMIDLPISAWGK